MVWYHKGRQSDPSPFIVCGDIFLALFSMLGCRWFRNQATRAVTGSVPIALQVEFDTLVLSGLCLDSRCISAC